MRDLEHRRDAFHSPARDRILPRVASYPRGIRHTVLRLAKQEHSGTKAIQALLLASVRYFTD